jgi:hypothetical protein
VLDIRAHRAGSCIFGIHHVVFLAVRLAEWEGADEGDEEEESKSHGGQAWSSELSLGLLDEVSEAVGGWLSFSEVVLDIEQTWLAHAGALELLFRFSQENESLVVFEGFQVDIVLVAFVAFYLLEFFKLHVIALHKVVD